MRVEAVTTAYGYICIGNAFKRWGRAFPAVVRDGQALPLALLLGDAPADLGAVFADWQRYGAQIDTAMASPPTAGWRPESDFAVHLPFMPGQLFGAGANYRRHVIDLIVAKGSGGAEHLSPEERRVWGTEFMDRRAATGLPFIWVGSAQRDCRIA